MEKTPKYIKKTLDEVRSELLKNKKLFESRKSYLEKFKQIFQDKVVILKDEIKVSLNDNVKAKMSSTGSGKTTITSTTEVPKNKVSKTITNKNNKIIFLNNEVLDEKTNDIDEANNELSFNNENIIELKDEIHPEPRNIIELKEEVDEIINLTNEVVEEPVHTNENVYNQETKEEEDEIINLSNEVEEEPIEITENIQSQEIIEKPTQFEDKASLSSDQLSEINEKISDLDVNSNELTDKLDELLNQKNLFSEKFNDELDIKLNEALNRSEDNIETKLVDIKDTYQQEFSKYEDEANKNFANLEDQIGQLNNQFINIQENISSISQKIEQNLGKLSATETGSSINDAHIETKINDLKDYNLKIENSLNNINNRIEETLERISNYKIEANEKIEQIKSSTEVQINSLNQKIDDLDSNVIERIEEKQKNKSESEKLQDKFDQLSKIMDMQNMRMLQMYHSNELQYSHSILQNNVDKKNNPSASVNLDPEKISNEFKKEVFPKLQKEMDKQFDLLKAQLSEYEIKSILDRIKTTDLNKEFKRPTKKFSNLFDAKKYVKDNISRKSREWIKNNESAIDEIAKKLLNK